jgi:hypothetical protein
MLPGTGDQITMLTGSAGGVARGGSTAVCGMLTTEVGRIRVGASAVRGRGVGAPLVVFGVREGNPVVVTAPVPAMVSCTTSLLFKLHALASSARQVQINK